MVPLDPQREPLFAASNVDTRVYSPVQLFFLARLLKLLRLQQQLAQSSEATPAPGEWQLKLLGKAIYSTYCDCVGLGLGNEARSLLDQYSSGRRVSP